MSDKPKVRQNVSLDPDVFDKFCDIAGRKGIKISTWVNQQMIEFIEDEEARLARRKERRERDTD